MKREEVKEEIKNAGLMKKGMPVRSMNPTTFEFTSSRIAFLCSLSTATCKLVKWLCRTKCLGTTLPTLSNGGNIARRRAAMCNGKLHRWRDRPHAGPVLPGGLAGQPGHYEQLHPFDLGFHRILRDAGEQPRNVRRRVEVLPTGS
jgi:hypothetical protein